MVAPSKDSEENEKDEILPGFKSIEEFTKSGFQAVMEVTKFSNNLPSGHSWDLYSASPSFQRVMNEEGKRVLQIMNMVLRHQGIRGNIIMRDLEEKFDLLVDCNDTVLERVGLHLDELSGIARNPVPVLVESSGQTSRVVSGSWNRSNKETSSLPQSSPKPQPPVRLLTAQNIERPQIKFKDKIDNSSTPFEPRIKEKPNALKPLAVLVEIGEEGECYSHPYEYELDLFKPLKSQLTQVTPQKYKTVEETPLVVVSKPEDVQVLVNDLKKYSDIAVDLEHHSYRTFQGFTCLMQISTRDTDYLVDTLELRDKLEILNEVFTDSKIVKVFHGAVCDIEWLQRDLCLYVVNMFDTHQAARVLNFAHLSLAYLLQHYCNVNVDKQFQLADWRIRPLPERLMNYAREDTHYLLYIYDNMKNTLIEKGNGQKNLLMAVVDQSRDICKKRYSKPMFDEDSHKILLRRNKKMFDNRQMFAFRELFRWRDSIARREDESTGYVLPNHMLFSVAELLPREMQGILALCSPIPPLVRQNLLALHQIILKAREQSVIRPVLEEEARMRPMAQMVWNKIDLESPLYCPHDMTHVQDFREDLPTLLSPLGSLCIDPNLPGKLHSFQPSLTVFEGESEDDDETTPALPGKSIFVSPYERYKQVRPFMDAQARADAEKKQQQEEEKLRSKQNMARESSPDGREAGTASQFKQQVVKRKREAENNEEIQSDDIPTPIKIKKMFQNVDEKPVPSDSPKRKKQKMNAEDVSTPPLEKQKKKKKKPLDVEAGSSQNESPVKKNSKQSSSSPSGKGDITQPFDYSQVDYSAFQGGSHKESPKRKRQFEGDFKPKGKKRKLTGKSNNKSFTYKTNRR